jgi:hypothetical protein
MVHLTSLQSTFAPLGPIEKIEPRTSYCMFQEPWWLDAVAGESWQSLEVMSGGELMARMPFAARRKFGFQIIRQPPLTPTLGPWVRPSAAATSKQIAKHKVLFNALIDQLPRWDYFEASFHHSLTNWLPFYWRGFEATTRYTYVLDAVSDLEKIWSGLDESVRRNIRKARKSLTVRTDLSIDQVFDFTSLTFERQGKRLPFGRDLVRRIDAACAARDARQMLFAMDAQGRSHAALYIVMDANYAYYLLGGADPELRSIGGQNLLLWEAIRFASERNLKFDFEGSMIESIEQVFRGFGAAQVPYLHVYGIKPLARMVLQALPRDVIRRLTRDA